MKHLWYKIIRKIAHFGLLFYFKKIEVIGKENLPKNRPILFVANHRNGMIDPILIATHLPVIFYFLTRASAFKNPIANFLLRSINMIPIYRIRDGVDSLQKNQEVFEACFTIFKQNESVLIFPEGNHGFPRRVRSLSKGFTRIAFGFLEKNADKELYIVPVGLNYENMLKPFKKTSIYIGEPILAHQFYDALDENSGIEKLKSEVFNALTKLTTHIEPLEKHDVIERKLKSEGINFTNPTIANQRVAALINSELPIVESNTNFKKTKPFVLQFISLLFVANTIIPILFWQWIKPKVKDIVMLSTYRFGLSVALIPLSYFIMAILIGDVFGAVYGWIYIVLSFTLVFIRRYLN
jgi:1-acyl-sn-glycerol-3-phosphate acyltransferase